LVLLFFTALERSLVFSTFQVNPAFSLGINGNQVALRVLVLLGCVWLIAQKGLAGTVWENTKRLWLLWPFVLISLASIAWASHPAISAIRVFFLFTIIFFAVYLKSSYSEEALFEILVRTSVAIVVFNQLAILFFPEIAIMSTYPYFGNWRGLFWHKIHLGSIAAIINIILLYKLTRWRRVGLVENILIAISFILSLAQLVYSDGVTAYMSLLAAYGAFAIIWAWLKLRPRMSATHYLLTGLFAIISVALLWTNLEAILGLFGRSASLTGRIPMWQHLWAEFMLDHRWLGHGFGVFWNLEAHTVAIQQAQGWPHPVLNADNGFINILIHVGIVGLVAFLIFFVGYFIRSLSVLIMQDDLMPSYFLVLGVLALFLNLAFSMFFELGGFLALLLILGWLLMEDVFSNKNRASLWNKAL
jgi:O-antigen ligase